MRTRLRLKELNTKRKKMMSFIFTHHTESEFSLSTYREAVKFYDFGELFTTKRLYLIIFAVSIVFISVVYTDARATALTQITKNFHESKLCKSTNCVLQHYNNVSFFLN